ncbi:hypothetical protein GGR54DRAFT_265220 [Hypoxylon sp. NC1633]|nr:hypothetical protein GGR54DRAFT_265220 [Hypoxylon sp. NC1633]
MAQTGSRIVILLIFTLYIRPIHTHPSIRHGERLDSHVLLPAASEDSCGFEGNPDLYGLGIRLGIYLQWIATFIANMFPQVQKEIGGLVDTNTIFLLAIFIATVVISSEPIDDGPHTVEILVLLYIFFGTVYSVLLFSSVRASRFGHYQYSVLGLCFRLTLVAAMSAYSVWYWFRGVELFSRTDCGTYAFLFAQGSQDTASTVFLYCNSLLKPQVHGTVSILRPTLIGISDLLVSLQEKGLFATIRMNSGRWREWQSLMESRRKEHAGKTRSEGGFRALLELMAKWITPTEQEVTSSFLERVIFIRDFLPSLFSILWPLNIFALCWNTIAIETTIVWNSITNVYDLRSTGQLIAFVIGLAGLLKVLISLWTNWVSWRMKLLVQAIYSEFPVRCPSRG